MGEAKRRSAQLRAVMIEELTRLTAPITELERRLARELEVLPLITAHREPAARLAWAKMKPRQCHANVSGYVHADPDKIAEHVLGWWRQGTQFVLHSVVRTRGMLVCVTPQNAGIPDRFEFALDPKITMMGADNDRLGFVRSGGEFPHVVRGRPETIIEVANKGLREIAAGTEPNRVWAIMDEMMGRLTQV